MFSAHKYFMCQILLLFPYATMLFESFKMFIIIYCIINTSQIKTRPFFFSWIVWGFFLNAALHVF